MIRARRTIAWLASTSAAACATAAAAVLDFPRFGCSRVAWGACGLEFDARTDFFVASLEGALPKSQMTRLHMVTHGYTWLHVVKGIRTQ